MSKHNANGKAGLCDCGECREAIRVLAGWEPTPDEAQALADFALSAAQYSGITPLEFKKIIDWLVEIRKTISSNEEAANPLFDAVRDGIQRGMLRRAQKILGSLASD